MHNVGLTRVMRARLLIVMTAIIATQVLSCAARSTPKTRLPEVAMSRLVENKLDYHGRRIQVTGIVAHRFEHYRLYGNWADFKNHIAANSIRMRFSYEQRLGLSRLHGALATVTGIFDSEHGCTGAIAVESFTRIYVRE